MRRKRTPYAPRVEYTGKQLDDYAMDDLRADAEQSEHQAEHGPFWPDRGITRESCLAYAADCRAKLARYATGGAHRAVLGLPDPAVSRYVSEGLGECQDFCPSDNG
jgi:hypothetical protein